MNVIIESVHFDADVKLLDYIGEKLAKLEKIYDRILKVDVYLKLENSGQIKDKIVELKLSVPKDTLFIKEAAKTFEEAIDKATDRARRVVKRHKETMRSY